MITDISHMTLIMINLRGITQAIKAIRTQRNCCDEVTYPVDTECGVAWGNGKSTGSAFSREGGVDAMEGLAEPPVGACVTSIEGECECEARVSRRVVRLRVVPPSCHTHFIAYVSGDNAILKENLHLSHLLGI